MREIEIDPADGSEDINPIRGPSELKDFLRFEKVPGPKTNASEPKIDHNLLQGGSIGLGTFYLDSMKDSIQILGWINLRASAVIDRLGFPVQPEG